MRREHVIIIIFGFFLLSQPLGAQTWGKTKRLTWTSSEYGSTMAAIAIDVNGFIHVVYCADVLGHYEIFYKKSTNEGSTWTTKRLSWNSMWTNHPAIAIGANNHIHVVWCDNTPGNYEVYYKRSTDGGANWSSKRLTYNSGYSYAPTIVIDSNNYVHVIWGDETPGNYELYYRRSTDGGGTWNSVRRLTWNSGGSEYPVIAVGSNKHLHVVWMDDTPGGNLEIYYKKSTNGGTNWTTKRLTYSPGNSYFPHIAINTNNIYVAYEDDTGGSDDELYLKKSTDEGTTWNTKRMTWNSGNSNNPNLVIDYLSRILLVWEDGSSGNDEVYYRRSVDGGETWFTKRLTWNSGASENPDIASHTEFIEIGGVWHLFIRVYVVWYDDTSGKNEIYFKGGIF
jgi:hypothetical protein